MSIHVSVIDRHAILEVDGVESLSDIPFIVTEHFFVISPDDKHDQFFTEKVQNLIRDYLDSIQYNVKVAPFSINLEIVLDLLKTFALNMTTISS